MGFTGGALGTKSHAIVDRRPLGKRHPADRPAAAGPLPYDRKNKGLRQQRPRLEARTPLHAAGPQRVLSRSVVNPREEQAPSSEVDVTNMLFSSASSTASRRNRIAWFLWPSSRLTAAFCIAASTLVQRSFSRSRARTPRRTSRMCHVQPSAGGIRDAKRLGSVGAGA